MEVVKGVLLVALLLLFAGFTYAASFYKASDAATYKVSAPTIAYKADAPQLNSPAVLISSGGGRDCKKSYVDCRKNCDDKKCRKKCREDYKKCRGKNRKITLCHIPPGDPDSAHTITVGRSAVRAHLKHGDTLGECPSKPPKNVSGVACGDTIFESKILEKNLTANGTCITIRADNLVLDCAGYSITGNNSDTNGWGVNISGRVNVTVRDCVVTNFSYGIVLYNSSNSTINNNTLINNTGVGGFVGTGIMLWNGSSNNTIINNNATGNREGLVLVRKGAGSPNIGGNIVLNNTFESNSDAGLLLSSADGNNITANVVTRNNRNVVISASEYNIIESNNITNSTANGGLIMSAGRANFNNVTNNFIADNNWFGLYMAGSSPADCRNRIERNTITGSKNPGVILPPVGIWLQCSFGGGGTIIFGNVISSNKGAGIQLLDYGTNINITSNNIINNSYIGINFSINASFNIIEKNNITNHPIGILIRDSSTLAAVGNSSNNSIVNNTIISTLGGVGIKIEVLAKGKAEGNIIRENNLSLGHAIMIENASETVVENNTFTDNQVGILIQRNAKLTSVGDNKFVTPKIPVWVKDAFTTTINRSILPDHLILENTSANGGYINFTRELNLQNGSFLIQDVFIGFNFTRVNSAKTPGLNASAILTFRDLPIGNNLEAMVDVEDDGTFVPCNEATIPKCERLSFNDGIFVYNVTHFTTFSSRNST